MLNKQLFTSNSDEWFTPIDFFNNLNKEFNFTLDPCSSYDTDLCPKKFYKKDNGLSKSWANNIVFVNPPYSNIREWVIKCYNEWLKYNITIVLLIPARTDTIYFHNYIYPYCELRFIKGRLRFSNSRCGAPFPSMLCIFRKKEVKNNA